MLLRFGFVAPVFAHFNETIASLTTVRAFQQQQRLIEKNDKNNDNFGRAMLSQNLCFRWLSIRLNSVNAYLSFAVPVYTKNDQFTKTGSEQT